MILKTTIDYSCKMSTTMASSIRGHISYISEVNSKRSHDFPLIGRKPNEILQFKSKKTYGIKIQTEIKYKVHAEGE